MNVTITRAAYPELFRAIDVMAMHQLARPGKNEYTLELAEPVALEKVEAGLLALGEDFEGWAAGDEEIMERVWHIEGVFDANVLLNEIFALWG